MLSARLDGQLSRSVIFISGSDHHGEGELKMIDVMLETALDRQGSERESHVLVGNDADLILMSMASLIDEDVYVMTDAEKKRERGRGKRWDQEFRFFSTNRLAEAHCEGLGQEARLDFVALSIFVGNDYLPKMRGVNLQMLWRKYQEFAGAGAQSVNAGAERNAGDLSLTGSLFTAEGGFHWPAFTRFMEHLAGETSSPDSGEHTPVPDHVGLYLEGVLWNIDMYVSGQCASQDYIYSHPAPTPKQILEWCRQNQGKDLAVPRSTVAPLSPSESLLALMPRAARSLMPQPLQSICMEPPPWLTSIYEDEECPECPRLRKNLNKRNQELFVLRKRISESSDNEEESLSQELLEGLWALKEKHRQEEDAYVEHKRDQHRDLEIPWEALQNTVGGICKDEFSSDELGDVAMEKSGTGSYGVIMQKANLKTDLILSAATPLFKFNYNSAPKQPTKSHRPLRAKGGGVLRGPLPRLPPRARKWALGARAFAAFGLAAL